MDYSTIQEGGLGLPGLPSVPGVPSLTDMLAQAKAAAAKSATDAIAANPAMAQLQGITGTLQKTVKAVADAPATIKQVVKDTVAESTGQPLPPAEGEEMTDGEAPLEEEMPYEEEAAADESFFGGGGGGYTMLDKPICYRTYGPVYVTHDRNNIQIVPIKLGNRRLKHKLTKKITSKKHKASTKKIVKKGARKTSRKSGKRRSRRS